jgi:hypothetical protein
MDVDHGLDQPTSLQCWLVAETGRILCFCCTGLTRDCFLPLAKRRFLDACQGDDDASFESFRPHPAVYRKFSEDDADEMMVD